MFHLGYIDPGSIYTVGSGLAAIVGFALSAIAVVAVLFKRVWAFVKRHWRLVTVGLSVVVIAAVALLGGRATRAGAPWQETTSASASSSWPSTG